MPANKKFEPGEIAVLRHSMGGRIMVVHESNSEGVYERAEPSQQKYVRPYHLSQVIKTDTPRHAYELVGRLMQIETQLEDEKNQSRLRANRAWERAIDEYQVWEDDS